MKTTRLVLCLLLVTICFGSAVKAQNKQQLLTVAEKSSFKSTSTHADVMDFIKQLKKMTPYMRVETIAKSTDGKDIPLLIIGKPLPKDPASLVNDKRVVVYFQANIHAGEVEGKEAALMLARDILLKQKPEFLDKIILLICPIYNPDGNDKIGPITKTRPGQVGPDNGAGERYNGQNLDLNRDAMKAEAPETQGLLRNILNRWDPAILVDCHTTDGSLHEEPVTFTWAVNPNGSLVIRDFMHDKFFPTVSKTLKEKYKTLNIPYGEYLDRMDITKGWETFSQEPRYVVNYAGLRNRLSFLNENNVYSDYKTRIDGCYNLLRSILDFTYENKDEIKKLIKDADEKTIARGLNPAPADSFAVEYKMNPARDKITVRSFEMGTYKDEQGRTRQKRTGNIKVVEIPYFTDIVAKRSVKVPFGYFLTVHDPAVLSLLTTHGIEYKAIKDTINLEVESFRITDLKPVQRSNQGHYTNVSKGDLFKQTKKFAPGTIFIPMAQKNANVAAYLLEAQTDDGMLLWNFFDRYVVAQWGRGYDYPVHRVMTNPANIQGIKFTLEKVK
jgi:hypothetical protein